MLGVCMYMKRLGVKTMRKRFGCFSELAVVKDCVNFENAGILKSTTLHHNRSVLKDIKTSQSMILDSR
jgi:hypothetical protein